ncbi:LytTR family DNA-binding domain-containing protein [Muricauda oceani]|uniref:Response regulator transcription factor n=1 Tax=Flagellimonas oceani TaxID=2698672 RepID=A0A6G7J4H3_9FLAO|nr:LytTR family DNA-binding domain-containing protein [Allomuricauda oceani]MBW8243563.1 LytTR family DNA-binding domain-containing protein [Allomuricauda oceani]QII45773.1 response regulator transcription factor [Allomuricauda oceani]
MINKITTFIIEDDEETRKYIKKIVSDYLPQFQIIGESSTVKESILKLSKSKADLLLMDIMLRDGESFEILQHFPENTFDVLFITGHSQFITRAFEYFAFNYLLKPFKELELVDILGHFLNKRQKIWNMQRLTIMNEFLNKNGSRFLIHTGNEYVAVDLIDITHCKSEGNYTRFNLQNGQNMLASNPLKYYEQVLSYKGFFRITRFDLINSVHIASIYKKEAIILNNGLKIRLSQNNREILEILLRSLNQ